jgi:8-oxo-dGTP diphosphatase
MTNASPLLVAAGALVDADGLVLVQRRRDGPLAGLWEFPGGKVEPCESPQAALVRELHEELGIIVAATAPTPVAFSTAPLATRHVVLLLYRVRHWSGEPRALAASALAWHHPGALRTLPMPEADRPLVEALVAAAPIR